MGRYKHVRDVTNQSAKTKQVNPNPVHKDIGVGNSDAFDAYDHLWCHYGSYPVTEVKTDT